ncbi:hypothetical protein ITP53_11420 [Nonomuraea sp. K274]|uniref:Uncharacterized protein n=1 Tax=Nonomuraea cypriaca TaxID=1187855 RepID=A0A931A981_9ACTN|nr:hypothetical protein [Nonomuraea cypriaca]MBF8186348.1 hypothetical protein [Nonomuraea cypriaca]
MTHTTADDAKARLAAMHARGRAMLGARTTRELCDMYVLATAQRDKSAGDEARAAIITLSWIAEILEQRDPAASDRWYEAAYAIEIDMIARDEWIDGASDLAPHAFFGC